MRTNWELRDAAQLIGTNKRRLQGWDEKGLLAPSVAGGGKGSRRMYTFADLCMATVLLKIQGAVGERSALAHLDGLRQQVNFLAEQVRDDKTESPLVLVIDIGANAGEGDAAGLEYVDDRLLDLLCVARDAAHVVTIVPVWKPLVELHRRCVQS